MAYNQQQQQRYHQQSSSSTNCYCCCDCTSSHLSPPASQSPMTDPLVQAIATHLLQSSQTHLYSQYPKPHQHQHHHQQKQQRQQQQQEQQEQTQSLLSSLLRRIDALESSLHRLSPPPPTTLRDMAARTIQTHFRSFLVRRSRTLGQLKDLAFIKSSLNTLKSSISDEPHLQSEPLSQKAMDLLLKLDSIQGDDQMIRDGKRSISRELVRFLEFVDGISLRRRQEISAKSMKNMASSVDRRDKFVDQRAVLGKADDRVQEIRGFSRFSENEEEEEEEHVELEAFRQVSDDEGRPRNFLVQNGVLVTRHGISSQPKKSVRFAENGNEQIEFVDNLYKEGEEIMGFHRIFEDDEEHREIEGSPQIIHGERNPRKNVKTMILDEMSGHCQGQNGNFEFSAPVPVQMEPRTDLMKKKKIVRVSR